MIKESSKKLPIIPSEINFNPFLIKPSKARELMCSTQRMIAVKEHLVYDYGIDIFQKTKRRDYVAPRAAFICFFANKFKTPYGINESVSGKKIYDVSVLEMARIAGFSDHTSVIHHIRAHSANMKDFTNFGEYYRPYYKLFTLIYREMFERQTVDVITKKMLIGAE